jgi:flagellar biogenesis protein FliO
MNSSMLSVAAVASEAQEGSEKISISLWRRIWRSLLENPKLAGLQRRDRRLFIRETVALGEKRFVSIVEVDGRSFLIGGGAGSVSLLSVLPAPEKTFEALLAEQMQGPTTR